MKYTKNFSKVAKQVKELRHEAAEESILRIEADAKLNAPVLTGRLRESISHQVDSDDNKSVAKVGTNVEYAPIQELKYHYLENAVDSNLGEIIEIIKRKMSQLK